jgi:ubiquinone/menaquinone biosynthesis C-methylase UbiE
MNQRNRSAQRPSSPPARRPPRYVVEADVLEGLERFAHAELEARVGMRIQFQPAAQPGTLRFGYTGDLAALLALRSVVAVYLIEHFDIPRPKALLGNQQMGQLLGTIATARELAAPGAYRTLRLSAAGDDSAVLTRLKGELADRLGLEVADEGDLLLRLRRAARGAGWELLIRLSPRPLATRAWRVCNLPGALNATLAHAMMALTQPREGDSVLNLACGSGTLLVELLALCQPRRVIGCDTDATALACARENVRAAGYAGAARLEEWDAGATPLSDASMSVICADLPFGQLVGSHVENEALYPRVFAEAARVAAPGARMVLLTHEIRLLERVAGQFTEQWQPRELIRVRSGGMTPAIASFSHRS